jgi:hypothetical protein
MAGLDTIETAASPWPSISRRGVSSVGSLFFAGVAMVCDCHCRLFFPRLFG